MPPPEGMKHLVYDSPLVLAPSTDRDPLTTTNTTNVRVTAAENIILFFCDENKKFIVRLVITDSYVIIKPEVQLPVMKIKYY